jgi:hypothetical protein
LELSPDSARYMYSHPGYNASVHSITDIVALAGAALLLQAYR